MRRVPAATPLELQVADPEVRQHLRHPIVVLGEEGEMLEVRGREDAAVETLILLPLIDAASD